MIRLGADDTGKGHPEGVKTWNGINGLNVTEFILLSRKLMRNYYDSLDNKESVKTLSDDPVIANPVNQEEFLG